MAYRKEVAEDKLTYNIIGRAIELHKQVGPHHVEEVYRKGLCKLLRKHGLNFLEEVEVPILLEDEVLGKGYVDIVVEGEVALELKAVKRLTDDHFNQLGRNVALVGASRGLLLNFGESTLTTRRWANGVVDEGNESARGDAKALKR